MQSVKKFSNVGSKIEDNLSDLMFSKEKKAQNLPSRLNMKL